MAVAGIVLAAGSSKRLGRPKQTLPLGDSTVLGLAVSRAEQSRLDPVVVVLGGAADEATERLELARAVVTYNDAYEEGCARSILAGLDTVEPVEAVMLLLGDMPGVLTAVVNTVIAAWESDRTWGAITSYRGDLGHPLLFSRDAFADLRALHGDKAVWKIVDREAPGRMHRVEVDEALPRDIDTWEDYEAVRDSDPFL